jgi:hypothetical protein
LDRDLDNIKIKILVFQGKNDLKVYLEWEKKRLSWFFVVTITLR